MIRYIGQMVEAASHAITKPNADAQPLVGIIVVHYNCLEDTVSCLQSLKQLSYPNYFVIVVDNKSPNGSGFRLKEEYEGGNVKVIINAENCGFAAGNNVGIRYALAYGARLLWLVNSDATVEPEALDALVKRCEEFPEAGAFGSKILYKHTSAAGATNAVSAAEGNSTGERLIWSAGGNIDFTAYEVKMVGWRENDNGQYDRICEFDYLPACSLLVRSSVINQVSYMPEEYFMSFEETDWCTRIRQHGYKLYYVPQSIVWHDFRDNKVQEPLRVYYYNRNNLLFWFRFGQGSKIRLVLRVVFSDIPRVLYALYRAPDKCHKRLFRAHLASRIDFLRGRFGPRSL